MAVTHLLVLQVQGAPLKSSLIRVEQEIPIASSKCNSNSNNWARAATRALHVKLTRWRGRWIRRLLGGGRWKGRGRWGRDEGLSGKFAPEEVRWGYSTCWCCCSVCIYGIFYEWCRGNNSSKCSNIWRWWSAERQLQCGVLSPFLDPSCVRSLLRICLWINKILIMLHK